MFSSWRPGVPRPRLDLGQSQEGIDLALIPFTHIVVLHR
jgi:hypothetical protein